MTPSRPTDGTRRPRNSGRAYGYTRVSTDEQRRSGLGIEAQTASVRDTATRSGLTIVALFTDEGVSGSLPPEKRPGMSALLAALRRGDTVITARRDRLHRDREIAVDVDRAIRAKRAHLLVADAPTTGDAATDEMRTGFDDLIAVAYRTRVRQATRAGLAAKRQRGERFSRHAPYGYRFTTPKPTHLEPKPATRLEPEPVEQTILAIMRECHEAGYGMPGTARELNRLGHRTRAGKEWRHQYVRNALARNDCHEAATSSARP